MAGDACVERPLFGGSISSTLPLRFQDVSNVRDVPDHQEAFVDPSRDESIVFELLDLKDEVGDEGSAGWFLRDLAAEQDAEGSMILEHTSAVEPLSLSHGGISSTITTAVGQMVYLANLRLKGVGTDVLITVYEPIIINPLSESAMAVGTGPVIPAAQSGLLPASEIFRLAVTGFKVNDWSLFGTTGL